MRFYLLSGLIIAVVIPAADAAACCRIGKPRITVGKPRVTVGKPRVTIGNPQITVGRPRIVVGTPRVTVGNPVDTVADITSRTGKAIGQPVGEVLHTGGTVATNVYRAGRNAGSDTAATIAKAKDDAVAEAGRAVENVNELGTALRKYFVAKADDTLVMMSATEKRLREGKFADALWHSAVDPLTAEEGRAAQLAQESSLANTVGAAAAAAYGGPGGAAAYSAWYAYRASDGDVGLAIKAGIISGATSAGLSVVSGMPVDAANPAPDIAKKAIVAGAIGGLAVAAAGGDGDAIRDGFLKAGGMMVIQDGYRQFTGGQDLAQNVKSPTEGSFCTLAVPASGASCAPPKEWFKLDAQGNFLRNDANEPIIDISKVDPRYSYVGLASSGQGNWLISENGPVMNGIAKIPGVNAMAIFHDQWVITAPLSGWTNQATIVPAIVVTYLGTEAGTQQVIAEAIQKDREARAAGRQNPKAESRADAYLCAGEVAEESVAQAPQSGLVGEQKARLDQRSIFTVFGEGPAQFACAVVYQKDGKDYLPFYAENDSGFCAPKAKELAQNHTDAGWTCFVRPTGFKQEISDAMARRPGS
ncbi:MAG: hypothetical protein P0Y59_05855 [Candidatus Sphingomonas phytovorans]|nr:hypothetical protein [Sphingomonas sp.]WEK01214.1 MAG: hypothetical protein P0Y59_05855 [Sphingomonas sp.]